MKKTVGAVLVGSALLASLATGLAMAEKGSTQAVQVQEPAYTGSIAVQSDDDSQAEGAETSRYQAMAKVSMDEAIKAAQAALNTTQAPARASLENENGYLVWEVVIGSQEVKVDAGTGKVLHTEQVSQEGHEEAEEEHGNEEQGED